MEQQRLAALAEQQRLQLIAAEQQRLAAMAAEQQRLAMLAEQQRQAMLMQQQQMLITQTMMQPQKTIVPEKPKWPLPRLVITVIRCRRLTKGSLMKPNPYAILIHNGRQLKTNHLKSTTDPVWNQDLEFRNVEFTDEIVVNVFDKGTLAKDDFLGECQLTSKDFVNGAEVWFQLRARERRFDHVQGDVLLRFACIYA